MLIQRTLLIVVAQAEHQIKKKYSARHEATQQESKWRAVLGFNDVEDQHFNYFLSAERDNENT